MNFKVRESFVKDYIICRSLHANIFMKKKDAYAGGSQNSLLDLLFSTYCIFGCIGRFFKPLKRKEGVDLYTEYKIRHCTITEE